MMTRRIIVLLLLTIFCTACNSRPKLERPEGMPELVPCSITATFDGKAIQGVTILLVPLNGDSQWSPSGITDTNGKAYPAASYGFKGVPVGKYKVSFTCFETDPNYNENDPKSPWAKSSIPLKYSKSKSKEVLEVQPNEKNDFVFNLDAGEESILVSTKL